MQNKLMYSGKFLEIYEDEYDNGKTLLKWERCSRKKNTNAVAIVPYHIEKNKFVLISEFRIPIRDREIGFPAGLLDKENESIENAIARELKEETGLDLVKIHRISPMGFNTSGMSDEAISIAYVDVTGELSNKFQEETEDITAFLASKTDIAYLLNHPDIKWGAKAWIICDMLVNGNPFN